MKELKLLQTIGKGEFGGEWGEEPREGLRSFQSPGKQHPPSFFPQM